VDEEEHRSCFLAGELDELEGTMPGISAMAFDVLAADGTHPQKAGPCAGCAGNEDFLRMQSRLTACLSGSRLAKDRAADTVARVMIPRRWIIRRRSSEQWSVISGQFLSSNFVQTWVPHPSAFFADGWDTTNPIRPRQLANSPFREAEVNLLPLSIKRKEIQVPSNDERRRNISKPTNL